MIAVLCAFLAGGSEAWATEQGREALADALDHFAAARLDARCVATDLPAVAALAEGRGLEILTAEALDAADDPLPVGWPTAARMLSKRPEADRLLLLDVRNPLLAPALIEEAAALLGRMEEGALVSVRLLRDHPCQYERYYRYADLGVLHLPDPDFPAPDLPEARGLRFSLPFRMNWDQFPQVGDGPLFREEPFPAGVRYVSAGPGGGHGPVFLRCGPRTARVGVAAGAEALAAVLGSDGFNLRLEAGQTPGLFSLRLPEASPDAVHVAKLIPLDPDGGDPGQAVEVVLPGDAAQPFSCAVPSLSGFAFHLFRLVENGLYDYVEPTGCPPLWSVNQLTMTRMNLVTGKHIRGRQGFPEVYELDGSVLGLPRRPAPERNPLPLAEDLRPFPLEQTRSVKVVRPFDLLRYAAKKRRLHDPA